MANYPQELAQDALCQSHTGYMTGLWFLPLRLNTTIKMYGTVEEKPPSFLISIRAMFPLCNSVIVLSTGSCVDPRAGLVAEETRLNFVPAGN